MNEDGFKAGAVAVSSLQRKSSSQAALSHWHCSNLSGITKEPFAYLGQ